MSSLVRAHNVSFSYSTPRPRADQADWTIDAVSVEIESRATVGIVGETGSGKSTFVRLLSGLLTAAEGEVIFRGRPIADWYKDDPLEFRRQNQLVFQNPASSFDPRMRMGQSLSEPVRAIERRSPSFDELAGWLARVGLQPEALDRYPHQLSGGQLQRIAIARALSVEPAVLYADEPTSALDVSVQAQVLNLLMALQEELGLTLVMVSHDLAVITRVCEYIIVMKDGRLVEAGPTAELVQTPRETYTAALLEAAEAVGLDAGHGRTPTLASREG